MFPARKRIGDDPPSSTEEGRACRTCGRPTAEEDYDLPLCSECRDKFSRPPLPVGVKAVFVLAIALCAISFLRFPTSVSAAVALERGRGLESVRQYAGAVQQYERALNEFPGAPEATARLAICYFRTGYRRKTVELMMSLGDVELSVDTIAELDAIVEELNRLYP